MTPFQKLRSSHGLSLIEVLVALMLTGVLASAAFKFYSTAHSTSETQHEVSDLQVVCRNTLMELKKHVRMAGYKVENHTSLELLGSDTLAIYLNETQPVDTILYYLEEFTEAEYDELTDLPDTIQVWRLLRKQNSDSPSAVSDYLTDFTMSLLDESNVEITVTAIASKKDFNWPRNNGYRLLTLSERVRARNAG